MKKIAYWECPSCGWRISNIAYQRAIFDYPCIRCGMSISNFVPKLSNEEEKKMKTKHEQFFDMIESIDEWFFDKIDARTGKFPNVLYRILALLWFIPNNFICKWHYRIFVRGVCAIKGCDEHYSCGWSLPEDVCEWYCKRCDAEGIDHVVYTYDLFCSDTPLRNFWEALRGR